MTYSLSNNCTKNYYNYYVNASGMFVTVWTKPRQNECA